MPFKNQPESRLQVAIIGAGPAGSGAAIEFFKLPFIRGLESLRTSDSRARDRSRNKYPAQHMAYVRSHRSG